MSTRPTTGDWLIFLALGFMWGSSYLFIKLAVDSFGTFTLITLRLLIGADHRIVLPASALFGAAFLVACDLVARTLLAPVEMPVGVVTAIIGGPFFLWLLVRES